MLRIEVRFIRPTFFIMNYDMSTGFWTGKAFFSWGTEYQELIERLEIAKQSQANWCMCAIKMDEGYGFKLLLGEFRAPRPNRPVLQASYEIDAVGEQIDQFKNCEYFSARISKTLGPAFEEKHHQLFTGPAYASGQVKFTARWRSGGASLGISLYGAPRDVMGGRAVGSLWLNWEDERQAAKPYLPEFADREIRLRQLIQRSDVVTVIALESQPEPAGKFPGEQGPFDLELARSRMAVRKALSLQTPREIQSRLSPNEVMLWKSAATSDWGLSTYYDTVSFTGSQETIVKLVRLTPAKGSGSTSFNVGDLYLQGSCDSPQITSLADALRQMPNTTVNYEEYPDC
jgi:hypothetical protein